MGIGRFAFVIAAGMLASGAWAGQDGPGATNGGMAQFRADTMNRIHAENRAALQESLRRSQAALLEQTRERYLAQHSGWGNGTPAAKAAP